MDLEQLFCEIDDFRPGFFFFFSSAFTKRTINRKV